jgi:hypothetical protein
MEGFPAQACSRNMEKHYTHKIKMLAQQGNRERERERERERRWRVPFLASPETDPAAKYAGDGTPVEGGRQPREKPTAKSVGHNQ